MLNALKREYYLTYTTTPYHLSTYLSWLPLLSSKMKPIVSHLGPISPWLLLPHDGCTPILTCYAAMIPLACLATKQLQSCNQVLRWRPSY